MDSASRERSDRNLCYRALQCRDARFDGVIFVAVRSTGVYCRPICPARTPRFENCVFYSSAAAAQAAGFRACLRCRPESAPEWAAWRGTSNTVARALALISEGALDGSQDDGGQGAGASASSSMDALAARLGVGERQMRRLFRQHLGASPIAVAQTRRVLFAKQLIHDTRMPMTAVAMAAGFGSVRRFNETFQALYRRPPSALRHRSAGQAAGEHDAVCLRLRYRPPYDWAAMLAFLEARAIPGVEAVENGRYHRSVALDGSAGTISVCHVPARQSLGVSIRFANLKSLPAIVARVRRQFDLGADIATINAHLARDPGLAPWVEARPGLRAPGGWDGFELAVRAVLGQQISVAAARRLAGQLVALHGEPLPPEAMGPAGLARTFPVAARLAQATTLGLGMPAARLAALKALAVAAAADPGLFQPAGSLEAAVERLRAIRGVGEWTAQYIALRALREMDAFPATDVGLLRGAAALRPAPAATPAWLLERAEAWRPWRAYAAQHLWAAAAEVRNAKEKQ